MEDKRYAVLIDSDNISAKYISRILDEMTKYGIITYKRIYGDWTSSQTSKWKQELLENSITPIQQFSNTTGKNATDSALIIDAMDILYTNNVDGFCIVSSDSDFTRLASRLRESGMDVIGMGEKKTPRSFRAACTVFTSLDILMDNDEEDSQEATLSANKADKENGSNQERNGRKENHKSQSNVISKSAIENDIIDIIIQNENNDKATGLSEVGNRLIKKYPDFDVRNYGYSLLSKFLEEMPDLELKKENKTYMVGLRDNKKVNEEIVLYLKSVVKNAGNEGVDLSELGNILKSKYKKFNVKDYGYTKFLKFVQSIDRLEVREDNAKRNIVYWV